MFIWNQNAVLLGGVDATQLGSLSPVSWISHMASGPNEEGSPGDYWWCLADTQLSSVMEPLESVSEVVALITSL